MATHIVGLDFGRDTVRAIELQDAASNKPTVVRYHEVPLPAGAVRSGEVREVNTVVTALKRLWAAGGFRSKDVVLGMGNQRVLVRELAVARSSLKQIRESLPFHVQDLLPVPVSEALLDFFPISEGADEGNPTVNGLLIAATKESVMANVLAVKHAGLNPVQVDLIPFALTRILSRGSASQGTVALVDIGASTTQVVVVVDGVPVFVRMIPGGGHDITAAIAARLEIPEERAEGLKRASGLGGVNVTDENGPVVEVIHSSAGELLNSLRNTLHYFVNNRHGGAFNGILLTGGGAQLAGFREALSEVTKLPVTLVHPFGNVNVAKSVKTKSQVSDAQAMTVALGLALGSVA